MLPDKAAPTVWPYSAAPKSTSKHVLSERAEAHLSRLFCLWPCTSRTRRPGFHSERRVESHGRAAIRVCDEGSVEDLSRRPPGAEGHLVVVLSRREDRHR